MAVTLPDTPSWASANPALLDFGAVLEPGLGGPSQYVGRLGDRYEIAVQMPPMEAEVARVFISRLTQAKKSSLLMPFPQAGVTIGAEGAPRVNGAGQAGTVLAIDGLPPAKAVKEGWFFSVVVAGRRYVHQITTDAVANGGGAVTLSIEPMLRVSPTDNAVVELAQPMLEGFVQSDGLPWSIDVATHVGLSFTVRETE
ncbi:hypothetical protein [Caulobacter sp. DWR3-1-2]|uniref:hypothetical protein n=1 Tax=Caulobacter sp. DWR3-1-2 TaxID=2804647 RepID=UPI003CF5E3FC